MAAGRQVPSHIQFSRARGICSLSLSSLKGNPEPQGQLFRPCGGGWGGERQRHGAHQLSAELTSRSVWWQACCPSVWVRDPCACTPISALRSSC